MKTHSSTYLCLLTTVILLCDFPFGISAEAEKKPGYWTTSAADKTACQRQLNMIYGAIQEYQKRKEKLPGWLSDLVPDYIHNPNVLVCPFVINTGGLKKWKEEDWRVFGDPASSCTYTYEFNTQRFNYIPGWTTRDYKQRQMELIGFGVPIVRCFGHRPILNLGFDGSIYESPREWEDNFVRSKKHYAVFHDVQGLTNRAQNELIRIAINPRNPYADARLLDLSTNYNSLLFHLAQIDPSGKLLPTYPAGLQRIGGVNFDVRGLVHLTGKAFPISFPEKVQNISVDRKCASVHFLHGTMFDAPVGSKVASYTIHQSDGSSSEVPILYGKDVKTRWFNPNRESEPQSPEPAWVSPRDFEVTGKSLRLYVNTWKNPEPDLEIKSIDFISHMTESAPFLIAITVE